MICPFLTNQDEEVECFKECAFYSEKSKNEECPFAKVDFKEIDTVYGEKINDEYINEKGYYMKNYMDYFKYKLYPHC